MSSANPLNGSSEIMPEQRQNMLSVGAAAEIYAIDAANEFMHKCGLDPTPDAVDQVTEVFLPCLRIMCERGYAKDGSTWKVSGMLGILHDVRKKFERLWYFGWSLDRRVPDHGYDLINYIGFYLRAPKERFGEWGEPGRVEKLCTSSFTQQ